MAELIVVTGPPGAGKSTVARALSGLFDRSALVPGDDFFAFVDRGHLAPWTAAAHAQNEVVTTAAAAAAGRLAAGGYTVVYDGVLGPWFLDRFLAATGLDHLHHALLLPPKDVCLQRVSSREGHGFTDLDAAAHMYADFAHAPVDARHVVRTVETPDAQAARLAELVGDGSIVVHR